MNRDLERARLEVVGLLHVLNQYEALGEESGNKYFQPGGWAHKKMGEAKELVLDVYKGIVNRESLRKAFRELREESERLYTGRKEAKNGSERI